MKEMTKSFNLYDPVLTHFIYLLNLNQPFDAAFLIPEGQQRFGISAAVPTFNDNDARGLIGAVYIGGYAGVFAAVLGPAVDDLHRHHAVRVGHRVVMLRQLLPILVPEGWREKQVLARDGLL